jgi:hypothetical protein
MKRISDRLVAAQAELARAEAVLTDLRGLTGGWAA